MASLAAVTMAHMGSLGLRSSPALARRRPASRRSASSTSATSFCGVISKFDARRRSICLGSSVHFRRLTERRIEAISGVPSRR